MRKFPGKLKTWKKSQLTGRTANIGKTSSNLVLSPFIFFSCPNKRLFYFPISRLVYIINNNNLLQLFAAFILLFQLFDNCNIWNTCQQCHFLYKSIFPIDDCDSCFVVICKISLSFIPTINTRKSICIFHPTQPHTPRQTAHFP